MVYYDELAKQEDDIILTVEIGKQGEIPKRKNPIPIEEVIRTKWKNSIVSWNGRTANLRNRIRGVLHHKENISARKVEVLMQRAILSKVKF